MAVSSSCALLLLLTHTLAIASAHFFGCENGKLACRGPDEWCQEQCGTTEDCKRYSDKCANDDARGKVYTAREKRRKASLHQFWKGGAAPKGFKNDAYVELKADPMAGGFLHKDGNGTWSVWPRMGGKSFDGFLGYGYDRVKAEGGMVARNIDPSDWDIVQFPVAKTGPASGGGSFWTEGPRTHQGDYNGMVGKTLRFTIGGLAALDCGCNANFYAVKQGGGCDGSGQNGGLCEEIDFFEGNKWSWHSTIHALNDGGQTDSNGLCSGYGGTVPTAPNFPSFDSTEYGPKGSMIDTEKAFAVAVSFPKDRGGKLKGMAVELSQEGKPSMKQPLFMHLYDYKGSLYTAPGAGGGTVVENGMAKIEARLNQGITAMSSMWHPGNGAMRWLDGAASQHGPNNIMDGKCTWDGGCSGYSISQIAVEDLGDSSGPPIVV